MKHNRNYAYTYTATVEVVEHLVNDNLTALVDECRRAEFVSLLYLNLYQYPLITIHLDFRTPWDGDDTQQVAERFVNTIFRYCKIVKSRIVEHVPGVLPLPPVSANGLGDLPS